MAGPPAVLIVVRHGARLDAADKQWHLNSPTPYDPPLTYGGWTQSRALGARIGNLLNAREAGLQTTTTDENNDGKPEAAKPKKKQRVVIHTSPFLRCVQTSVAIASGIAQNPARNHSRQPTSTQLSDAPVFQSSSVFQSSPRIRPKIKTDSPRLEPILEPASPETTKDAPTISKATLRVDAFLGEWLSPDYFEQITPPPSSVLMVAGSKADLLRREDYSNITITPREATATGGFPGGWGSPVIAPDSDKEDSIISPRQSAPRDRTNSVSSVNSTASRISGRPSSKLTSPQNGENAAYIPPIPHYAVSGSDPIPSGYVAHAKDACVDIDFQWDSMREPQNWGNGGEYGEEWSSMHKRFRRGLALLVDWYRQNDEPKKLTSRPSTSQGPTDTSPETTADEDTELVIILVTHGAGCNALIGAMTNQPALLDVGMASLTMAVLRPTPQNTPGSTPGVTPAHSRTSSRTTTLYDEYDIKLINSTEHIRRSSTASTSSSRTPSVSAQPYRPPNRYNANGSLANPFVEPITLGEPVRAIPQSGNFGSIRRTASVASSSLHKSYTPVVRGSIGLWSAPIRADEEAVEEGGEGDDMVLNFGDMAISPSSNPVQSPETKPVKKLSSNYGEAGDEVAPLSGGLWGAPRAPADAGVVPERDHSAKRRWTINEKSTL
ncbi:hypothetical protein V498_00592 [Pseudogymnoascus sp. VKM F-4517 (FW-2822)]|nr:hypothetical protein V498_00592 [Pseudogymnoascus sp. VKM F-4517 (FW-2822)]